MNIYIYSDESGVFDKIHNDYYVYGGIVLLGEEKKAEWERRYLSVEKNIRRNSGYSKDMEIKATTIRNQEKNSLFRSLNGCYKFGVIVDQKEVLDPIFDSKKDKQRYLDYVYKRAVKHAFKELMDKKVIIPDQVEDIFFFTDEHSTATNGRYELRESLERELKTGTYNMNYSCYFPPIFPKAQNIQVFFCNSAKKTLIRAADIVANKIYYLAVSGQMDQLKQFQNLFYMNLP